MTSPTDRAALIHETVESIAVLSRAFARRSGKPFADLDLSGRHLSVLFELARHGSLTMSHLAKLLDLTAGAVTQTVQVLVEGRLVEVTADPADRRVRRAALLPAAAGRIAEFEAAYRTAVTPAFSGIADADLQVLASVLTDLRAGMDGRDAPGPEATEREAPGPESQQ